MEPGTQPTTATTPVAPLRTLVADWRRQAKEAYGYADLFDKSNASDESNAFRADGRLLTRMGWVVR